MDEVSVIRRAQESSSNTESFILKSKEQMLLMRATEMTESKKQDFCGFGGDGDSSSAILSAIARVMGIVLSIL